MTIVELLDTASRLGVVGMFVVIIWGGFKRSWVWGWAYEEKAREAERWEEVARRALGMTEGLTEDARTLVEFTARRPDRRR